VKKIVGATTTRYIGKFYECDNATCSRFIFAGSQRIATVPNSGGVYYYHTDHLGSSSVITDAAGTKVQAVTYYPYGATRTNQSFTTPAVDVPYKYTSKELDSSTGLYFYEARYYDPVLARFISADTLVPRPNDPQGFNRYTYAGNNPFRYTDPTGHFKIKFKSILRVAGWIANPMLMQFVDPGTRDYTLPVAAGAMVGWVPVVGPVLAGAASGAVSGFLSGGDIGRSTWMGAAAAAVGAIVGGGLNIATQGEYLYISTILGSGAGGATRAALGGGNVVRAALISASVAAMSVYLQMQGVSPAQAQAVAQDQQAAGALHVSESHISDSLPEGSVLVAAGGGGGVLTPAQAESMGKALDQINQNQELRESIMRMGHNKDVMDHFLNDHHMREIYGGKEGTLFFDNNKVLRDVIPDRNTISVPSLTPVPFRIPGE